MSEKVGPLFASAQLAATQNTPASGGSENWNVANVEGLKLNWNRLFPYQLVVLLRQGDEWSVVNGPQNGIPGPFTLPIPPQTLEIDMNFTHSVEATFDGVVEQVRPTRFRELSFSGTTGVLPLRGAPHSQVRAEANRLTGGLLVGTINASASLLGSAQRLLNARQPNVIPESDFEGDPGKGTGYYQFLLLKRFLEWYDYAKAHPEIYGKIALGFAVWKESEVYLVTPGRFSVRRSAEKALHYNYNISLRAWRRIVPKLGAVGAEHSHATDDRAAMQRVIEALDNVRRVIAASRNVVLAARADVENLLTPLRQVILATKDATATALVVADFPYALARRMRDPFVQSVLFFARLGQVDRRTVQNVFVNPQAIDPELLDLLVDGISQARNSNQSALSGDFAKPFENPELYQELWAGVKLSALQLGQSISAYIDEERRKARTSRRETMVDLRDRLEAFAATFTNSIGVGDATYNALYGTTGTVATRTPSFADWGVLDSLEEAVSALDGALATMATQPESPMEIVGGMAAKAGLAFRVSASKYLAPVPYGFTLEQISERYLGTPDRWPEIAALNGLQSPYVDEIGFTVPLELGTVSNTLIIPNGYSLYPRQDIWVEQVGVPRTRFVVDSVRATATGQIVTVGAGDLSAFDASASVRLFSPHTCNSLQWIYLPSDNDAGDWVDFDIPGEELTPVERVGGVDLLLTDDGDLAITPEGDTRLAVGLRNLIQRIRIAVATPTGSLMRHPEFGFGANAGTNTNEVDANEILRAARDFVANEPEYSGVSYATVTKNGNSLVLSMGVGVKGVDKYVPISVSLT